MAIVYQQGAYWCEITGQSVTENSKGNPEFQLIIKPICHEDETPVERQIERRCRRVITEKTIEYLVEDLRQLGYDRDTFAELDPRHPNGFNFTGIKAKFLCQHKEYEGKDYENWSVLREYQVAQAEPIDKSKLKRLDGLYGKALKAAPKQERPSAAPAPQASTGRKTGAQLMDPPAEKAGAFVNDHGTAVDDDDVPF